MDPSSTTTPSHAFGEEIECTTVWIRRIPNKNDRIFFCNICRAGLFRFRGNIVSIIPGDIEAEGPELTNFPHYMRCYGSSARYGRCPAMYIVMGIVDETS